MVEGERLLGRFTVGERIGRGGNGTVHRAWDERLCRDVAVKSVEGRAAGRVLREAHAAARLNHPSIVTLYELGEENGTAYLVSELVDGPNLRRHAAAGTLSDRDLAEIGVELCGALRHAHAQGVVHRDIKPDNVLVRRSGRRTRGGVQALLADFGIAAIADAPTLTATGQIVGTLAYMAPEQATGEGAGPEADVYSLALTLYELWSGKNPVSAESPAATARTIGSVLPSLAEARPDLPEPLTAGIDAALAPDPGDRPTLERLQATLSAAAGALSADHELPPPATPSPTATGVVEEVPARPFAVLLSAGAIAVLGLIAGLPGLAVIAVALLVPAALLLTRPAEWIAPAAAPLLGLIGLAPAFVIWAAVHRRPAARAALAALAWAWTVVIGAAAGRSLGVASAEDAGAWADSGAAALSGLIAPLFGADAIAVVLIWVGAAVVLGALLEFAGPALLAVAGMVWTAGLVAALGVVGGPAAPSPVLTPALVGLIAWLVWDRAGRPELRGRDGPRPALAALFAGHGRPAPAGPARAARSRATGPLPDGADRARKAASRNVSAALHGAGSRAGLP